MIEEITTKEKTEHQFCPLRVGYCYNIGCLHEECKVYEEYRTDYNKLLCE